MNIATLHYCQMIVLIQGRYSGCTSGWDPSALNDSRYILKLRLKVVSQVNLKSYWKLSFLNLEVLGQGVCSTVCGEKFSPQTLVSSSYLCSSCIQPNVIV